MLKLFSEVEERKVAPRQPLRDEGVRNPRKEISLSLSQ
jgi:hypothetical protein